MTELALGREVLGDFEAVTRREWLVTNGLGSFACGTLAGVNTRRYHGLLVASLRPPLDRTMMVAKLDAVVLYRGQRAELATNEYADNTIAPRGYLLLESFRLDGTLPVWTWVVGDAVIEQRIWMTHAANTTFVQFAVLRASAAVQLELVPLCTCRDYHWQHRGCRETLVSAVPQGVQVDAYFGAQPYRILADRGTCLVAPDWYWNFRHRAESERGLDDLEDLYRPAIFTMSMAAGESAAVALTAQADAPPPAATSLQRERARQSQLRAQFRSQVHPGTASPAVELGEQLALAADQFIVERHGGSATVPGKTIIAGYPWFGDWGRDTMIALPGLTLCTARAEVAASILRTFAGFVSEGMLPNRFPDSAALPEYNTVDATLWYFVAIDEYLRRSADRALLAELYPVLLSIVRWHQHGTRHGIRVDPADGLLQAGEDGVQLTWMDAKVGDWVVTARIGKPVEINALWFNALAMLRDFAHRLGEFDAAREYGSAAESVARSFNQRFWYERGGYLHDVVDGRGGDDASLRPNQLFAISLRHSPLDHARARAVVDCCTRELWTPVGLRSLARADAHYEGRLVGGPRERDAAYHQGTVWSWLLGPFAIAHYRVYRNAPAALAFLQGIGAHLRDACIGQVSEVFDGDAPFTPRGCFAQAWGVAEVLRAFGEIYGSEAGATTTPR